MNQHIDFLANHAIDNPTHDLYKLALPAPSLLCFSPEAVQWMLQDKFDLITKPPKHAFEMNYLTQVLGSSESILTSQHGKNSIKDHQRWYKHRKTISKVFTRTNFETTFHKCFKEKSNQFIKRLLETKDEFIDIQSLFLAFTIDVTEENFFGKRSTSIENEASEFSQAFDKSQNSMTKAIFAGIALNHLSIHLLPYPFGSFSWKEKSISFWNICNTLFLKYHPESKKVKSESQKIHKVVDKYIDEVKKDTKRENRTDVLARFINLNTDEELSKSELRGIVLSLTFAGRDTTASVLSWLIFELTEHPDIQKKLVFEIDHILNGKDPVLADLSVENLPYLNGVIYEVLRLHPPVPTNVKLATEDIVFMDGITVIPKNTNIYYSPYAMGRNPLKYPEPNKFNPNRWIPFKQPNEYEFPVFQAGPRRCIGKDLALYETKYLMVKLLQNFNFELKTGEDKKVSYGLSIINSITNNKSKTSTQLLVKPSLRV